MNFERQKPTTLPEPKPELKPTQKDVVVYDCNSMTDEELTQAVLNSGSSTTGGTVVGGTK